MRAARGYSIEDLGVTFCLAISENHRHHEWGGVRSGTPSRVALPLALPEIAQMDSSDYNSVGSKCALVAQSDRAPDFKSVGCRFKPCRAHHPASATAIIADRRSISRSPARRCQLPPRAAVERKSGKAIPGSLKNQSDIKWIRYCCVENFEVALSSLWLC